MEPSSEESVALTRAQVPALERLHPVSRDLDWVPSDRPHAFARYTVGGSMVGFAVGVTTVLVHYFLHNRPIFDGWFNTLWTWWGWIGGGSIGGALFARRRMRQKAEALIAEARPLGELAAHEDGELVRVRGIACAGPKGVLPDAPGFLFTRTLDRGTIEERAVDFLVRDAQGEEVAIDVSDARLVHSFGPLAAGRVAIRIGDEVEILGRKHRQVDATVSERLARQEPMRTVLRAPRDRPLLIFLPKPVARPDRALPAAR